MWGPYCSTGWGRFFFGGGGRFDPSLAFSWVAPTTHSISCLDSSLGRVPAYDAGDPGSIPGGGKRNAWDTVPFWPVDPGSGIGFFSNPRSRILDPNPIFLRTYWQFWFKSSRILWKFAQIFFFSSSKLKYFAILLNFWLHKKLWQLIFFHPSLLLLF